MTEKTKPKKDKCEYKEGNQPINMKLFNKLIDKACFKHKNRKKESKEYG